MYIISKITVFDNDHELWETHIALNTKTMALCFSCWGKTKEKSRERAEEIADILNFPPKQPKTIS